MRTKIAIIGAGNVGATLALFLAQKELGDLVLIDINADVAKGKALDMMQAGAVFGFNTRIEAGSDYSLIEGAQIVAVTAGFPRKPGMDRLELLHQNRDIIDSIAENIKKYAKESIVIVVSNPVDVMTYRMWKKTGFESHRVMGQAGVLDSARLISFLSLETNFHVKDIQSLILGGHGDTMVPITSWTRANGIPLKELIPAEKMQSLEKRAQNGGGEIVALLKTGSAYYAPAAATAIMVEAVLKDQKRLFAVSCLPTKGEYGISDVYIGLPTIIGSRGVEQIIEVALTEEEKKKLLASAEIYKKSIAEL